MMMMMDKFLYWPVKKGIMTSPYGMRRDPISGEQKFHRGIDITVKNKKKPIVFASAPGTINFVYKYKSTNKTSQNNLGHYVVQTVENAELPYVVLYAHLKYIFPERTIGSKILPLDQIGIMGDTGRTTGVVLHFQLGLNFPNNHIDPKCHFIDYKGEEEC